MTDKTAQGNHTDTWLAYFAKGGTIHKTRGLNQQYLDTLYTTAHSRYSSHLYQDALLLFRQLSFLSHKDFRYTLGLGVTQLALKQYDKAVVTLNYTDKLDNKDPRASLALADCFIHLKQFALAQKALNKTIIIAKSSSQWSKILVQAQSLLSCINQERS